MFLLTIFPLLQNHFNPNNIGGGGGPCDAKSSENYPCLHKNNTALIKQISLFDTVMTNI